MKTQSFKYWIPALIVAVAVIFTVNISAKQGKTDVKTKVKTNVKTKINTKIVGGIEFVKIPAGCFMMGSKSGTRHERPVHKRCLKSFWMAKYETTQQQYVDVMKTNPNVPTDDHLTECTTGDCPVNNVGWDDAQEFVKKFNEKYKSKIRLPSEAEWEYAARAGSTTRFYWGDHISKERYLYDKHLGHVKNKWSINEPVAAEYEWLDINSGFRIHPVGKLKPNKWGLHDMGGNIEEWVQDCWNEDYKGAPKDGSAWMTGDCDENHIARGGVYSMFPGNAHITLRSPDAAAGMKNANKGFRVVLPE